MNINLTFLQRLIPLLAIGLFQFQFSYGQSVEIRGVVTDAADGTPLPGATVLVEGTSNGTITDVEGKYVISAEKGSVLNFSFVGFETSTVKVEDQTVINVSLNMMLSELNEIVVIGYGEQRKKVATGAISKVTTKDIAGFNVPDVQSALEGQVSGVIINESSGQPGADKTMLIRGISTNGDNSPLYIVDGLQVQSISDINSNDVESIDVLKDAASTAIYGARAANGVVIITTKKGSEGQGGTITYEGFASVSRPWKLPDMLNAEDYIALTREKFSNGNQLNSLAQRGFPEAGASTPDTDWMDEIFDRASIQNHRLSATFDNSYLSLEYWDQVGVIGGDKSSYKRYAVRFNSVKEVNDYFTVGENVYIVRVENRNIGVNDAFGTVIADAFAYDPITEVYDEAGQYGFAQSQWVQKEYINPLSRLFITNNKGHSDQVMGNAYLEFEPVSGLRFRSDVGVNYSWYNYRNFTPNYDFHPAFQNFTNDVSQGYGLTQSLQLENYINYTKQFQDHRLDVILGTTYRSEQYEEAGGSSSSIPDAVKFNDNWQYINSGNDSTYLASGTANVKYALISYYGRLIYGFRDRYLLTATLRRDGSSNFGANNRWGLFPSVSLGWIVSDEAFWNVSPISFLKVRGSWGINGNDRIPPLSYAPTIENVFTYPYGMPGAQSLVTGAAPATPPNPNIKWEESRQLDIGLEIKLFDDRLGAEVDYYIKSTKDLLMEQVIPGYIGATNNPVSNLGEIRNRGVEAAISYRQNIGIVNLTTTFNYTTFQNEVIDVAGDIGYIQGYSWPVRNTPISRMTEGYPVGHFVGYKTDGIFQTEAEVFSHINREGDLLQPDASPGDLRFVDVNGDGDINSEDITHIGSPWPGHIMGLSINATCLGFDFRALLSAQLGHEIFRAYERSDVPFTNYQEFWFDRWTEENPGNKYPRLVSSDPNNNQRPSDFYVEDASFLRLRNLQVGYNLPQSLLENIRLKAVRIYFSANNLFTFTDYNGFDPDIGTQIGAGNKPWILNTGIDKGYYPSNKTFGAGIRISM